MIKFKYRENDNIFFTSDTHFGHNNIIRYCNRPFNTVSEHDEVLINNWNKTVGANDTVFHLGDFAFCGSDKMSEILSRLNGHIILIKGNHDHFQNSILSKFEECYSQLHIEIGKKSVYLNHYPFLTYSGMYRNNAVIQLYGHVHSGPLSTSGKDLSKLSITSPYQLEVGVDNFNYTPISWKQVKDAIQWQIDNKKLYCYRNLNKWQLFKLEFKNCLNKIKTI